jgi:hypothetical protein
MTPAERRFHWISLGANGACLLLCAAAGVWLMVGWAVVNLAVSTTALRRKA